MNKITHTLLFLAMVLLTIWSFGYFGLHIGGFMHVVLALALMLFLTRILAGNKTLKKERR